tara:strand:+ start:2948 stop:3643 length:696 start_codon:yes stop_codon:yes gene_type:complete
LISDGEEVEKIPEMKNLILDTGLTKKELKQRKVEIGTFLELEDDMSYLGCKDVIAGKALDDRVGCYILLELARRLKNSKASIDFVFTVQEEIGLYGSKTSIYEIEPDWALAVDVTSADDSERHYHETTKQLGNGPCITVKDSKMISNVCIDSWLKEIAKKKKIPFQLDISETGTTDALSISMAKGGIPTAVVGVAVRNLHTGFGIANLKDIENCVKLLVGLLRNPPKKCIV